MEEYLPRSGYLNRQLYYLGQSIEYRKEELDPTNIGIMLPKNRCEGRTTIDGKIVKKSSSEELIRVRSIAVSDKKHVSGDHLSKVNFPPEETNEAFGLRCMTSL